MIKQRSVASAILFSIITCGIYTIFWYISLVNDLNIVTGDRQAASGGMVFLLSLVTCGIYGLFWVYTAGDKVDRIKQQRGQFSSNTGILYLLLDLFGFGIITYALLQNELNKLLMPL